MNFIVCLLVLLAWAPSFGFAQSIDSPQAMMNQGMGMLNKMTEAIGSMIGGGAGIPGRMAGGDDMPRTAARFPGRK